MTQQKAIKEVVEKTKNVPPVKVRKEGDKIIMHYDLDGDGKADTIVVYKRKKRQGPRGKYKYEVANVYLTSMGEKYRGRKKKQKQKGEKK